MKNYSIWKDLEVKNYPKLNDDKIVDILIIGGGITGISTLYHLEKTNLNVMLLEQNKIGCSTTGHSTGKLSYLQNDLIDKIRNSLNESAASLYLKSQIEAINKIVKVIEREKINCDLKKVDSYLYTNKEKEIKKIKSLEKFLNKNGINTNNTSNNLVKSKYMISAGDTYIFHPLKFIYGLNCKNIYEKTSIKKIKKYKDKYVCYTDKNKITCKYVIIASHYPYFNIPFLFPIKCSLEKSYLSASKKNNKPISLISYSNPFISIRTHNNYIIYLNNSKSLNKNTKDKKNYNYLKESLNDLKLTPKYLWSNIDIMTNDGLPYIGKLKERLLIGTGYNTWGLANGFLAGIILSDIVLNKNNKYIKLFSPNRKNIDKYVESINDIIKNIEGYIKGIGKEKKCPHMGCGLIYNKIEKTYDCPCHGSRFDINGKCISSPSNKNIDI